ncbi:MAG: DUF4157 domain-containing protein [bacterium]
MPPLVASLLANHSGRPLNANDRSELSAQFGHDLSDVRVHDDASAEASTRAVGAEAYAVGSHIVAPPRALDSATASGRSLLAHEITHVVQQSADGGGRADGAVMEHEAHTSSLAALSGGSLSATHGAAQVGLARKGPDAPHLSFQENALFANRFFGGPKGSRLVPSGWPYDEKLKTLWAAGKFDEFADVVRAYQEKVMGRPRQSAVPGSRQPVADGVVEPATAKELLAKPITPPKEEKKEKERKVAAPAPVIPKPPPGAATATTPKEKFLHFIETADLYGLPVQFLKKVGAAYDFETNAKGDSPVTHPWTHTMKMSADVYEGINTLDPVGPIGTQDLDTAYHESTHAYLRDLMQNDPTFKIFIEAGIKDYEHAPMMDTSTGKSAGETQDKERLFQEAAAEYVAGRAGGWWSAFLELSQYIAKGKLTVARIDKLRKEYNATMAQRVHGTYAARVGWSLSQTEIATTQPMSVDMKAFLDHQLLEDKIPDLFDDVAGFKKLIDEYNAYKAPP